ncbi:MAG: Gfo/Idh/MocA family oxidoreductase [Thermoguttaceae bacterium]|nr:Gfo/Idh/MocA family oxidoreductase [Thermoguttaceae bacterium]
MTEFSRRQFLSTSALTATALGFQALSGNAQEKKRDANSLYGVMIMGCGGRGGGHVSSFAKDPRSVILYVCDPDTQHAEAFAQKVAKLQDGKRPKVIRDMREALSDTSLDIVSCAATNHWHALCGFWAMQAKKHVYLEKPLCHNLHEGRTLVAAAKKFGVMCQTGTQSRSLGFIKESLSFLKAGGIGEIKLVRGLCYKRRKSIGALGKYTVPESVDYNLWSGPAPIVDPPTRPNFHYDWHWQRLYGNGDSGNQGPHQMDISRGALGVEEFPISVITYGGRLGYQAERKDPNYIDAGDTPNTEVSIFNYAGGKTLVFETRGLETDAYFTAKIGVIAYGSEGMWVWGKKGTFAMDKAGKTIKTFTAPGEDHFSNLMDAIDAGDSGKLNASARCGHLGAGLAHLGNISYYLGEKNTVSVDEALGLVAKIPGHDDNVDTLKRTVAHLEQNGTDLKKTPLAMGPMLHFDPKKEVFVDNAQATALETREYRGEFVVPTIS